MVFLYNYDTNTIHVIPTKTRNAEEIIDATTSMLSTLTTRGNQPNINILDNEALSIIKQGLLQNKIKYQLVLPYLHRHNSGECDIQTFQAHFITCLCAEDPEDTAKEWYRFLPQATLTLKLLHNCCFNPKFS